MRPIVLISPDNPFYAERLRGLAQGFQDLGYPCIAYDGVIDHGALGEWAAKTDVALCIEMNRVRASTVDWPASVPHAAWFADYAVNGTNVTRDLGANDHLYFLIHPRAFGIEVPAGRSWSVLLPSVTERPSERPSSFKRDFCMAGFIPAPLNDRSPVSQLPNGQMVTLQEFLAAFPMALMSQSQFSLGKIWCALDETCARIGCAPIVEEHQRHVFDEIIPRTMDRRRVVEAALSISQSIEIYGPETWLQWPQFAPYYRGFVSNPHELDLIFQTTRINLHNSGLAMHFRVLDCMAPGGFVLINETPLDSMPGGIRNYFEPDRDYGSYRVDNVADITRQYLADDDARTRIAESGRREVLRAHTNTQRARQILADFDLPQRIITDTHKLRRATQTTRESLIALVAHLRPVRESATACAQ